MLRTSHSRYLVQPSLSLVARECRTREFVPRNRQSQRADGVQSLNASRRPRRDFGRVIPLVGMHSLDQHSASSALEDCAAQVHGTAAHADRKNGMPLGIRYPRLERNSTSFCPAIRRLHQIPAAADASGHNLSALNAAWVRLVAPILRMMLRICTFAVLSLMPSSWAMILLALPCCS